MLVLYKAGLAPPLLKDFIKLKSGSGVGTRAVTRGDCEVPHIWTNCSQ